MAMKLLVTLMLVISIGEIYAKTLLERIRDDSDLSQVSSCIVNASYWASGHHIKGKLGPVVAC